MSEVSDPALAALLAEARAQFVESLPAKTGEIEALVARGAWGDARRAAHRLRGSCGTYGLPALSEVAGEIEDALLAAPGPEGDARARIAALADDLSRRASAAAGAP